MKKNRLLSGVAGTALASALGVSSPAYAEPPHNWAGFYAGLYAGGAWNRSNATTDVTCPPLGWTGAFTGGYFCDSSNPASLANASAVTAAGTGSMNSSNFVGGLQAGYNWQNDNIVYGLEADFGSFRVRGSREGNGVYPAGTAFTGIVPGESFAVRSSISTDWLLTARARLGWAVSNWLLYATGGLALTRIETTVNFSDNNVVGAVPGATGSGSNSKHKLGWTIGAGAEYALNNNWSLKAEYLYVAFGSVDTSATVTHASFAGYTNLLNTSTNLKTQIARAGINYKF